MRLAESLSLPVLVASSPARCPFPTRHPNYRGVLPGSIPAVASHFERHDLVVVFGAPVFMYHEFADGDYLPAGAELWAVTSDPDEAARAPVGHILIGDPAEAVKRLADTIPSAGRPPLAREPLPQADTTGPAFTEEAIMDALNAAKTDSTVFAHEWTSTLVNVWDRLEITLSGEHVHERERRAGLGPARGHRPAARRPVQAGGGAVRRRRGALLGQRAVDRRPAQHPGRLRRRAQQRIPGAERVQPVMHDPDAPGMELPGMDIPGIAAAYGVPSERVKTLSDLTSAVKDGLSADRPHLIEISQRRLADS